SAVERRTGGRAHHGDRPVERAGDPRSLAPDAGGLAVGSPASRPRQRLPDHEGLVSPDIEQARIGRDGRRTELHRLQDGCTGRQFFAGLVGQTPWFARVPPDPPGARKSPERNPYKPNKTIGKLNNWLCSYKSTLAPFHPPLQTSG